MEINLLENVHIKNLQNILKNLGERIEGNLICDVTHDNFTISRNINKIKNLQTLALGKHKICEIGINACHSLLLMLLVNPDAEYLLFDLNNHGYTEHCLNYIKSQFPNAKITTIFGNSVKTIYKYIMDNKSEMGTFDLCHIDGGHLYHVFSNDYHHVKFLSQENSAVIFDDFELPDIRRFLLDKINTNEIIQYHHNNIISTDLHFIYYYNYHSL